MAEIVNIDEIGDLADLDESLSQVPKEYESFQEDEGIPVHRAMYFDDLNALETGPWDRTGQYGAFVNLYGANGVTDLHVQELEPGGETTFQNHLYEEVVFVTKGQGFTVIGEDEEVSFEWSEDAIFFVPPNTPYKYINASDSSSRLVSQTPLPQLMTLIKNERHLFDLPAFWERDDDYYSADGTVREVPHKDGAYVWDSAFIPDLMSFEDLRPQLTMGAHVNMDIMPDSCMGAHMAEIPARMYKVAHKHGPGATLFMLTGEGYELMWKPGWDERIRIDWGPGSVFTPPAHWYHNHFNLAEDPARHFAVHCPHLGTMKYPGGIFFFANPDNIIGYVDEEPIVRERFEAELRDRGLESAMPDECYTNPDYEFSL